MKKVVSTFILLFTLAACSTAGSNAPNSADTASSQPSDVVTPVASNAAPDQSDDETDKTETGTKLLYLGHASLRLTSKDGTVIYIDPYAWKGGYDLPADIVLITHKHDDHNNIKLVTQKEDCVVITNVEALEGGVHNTFSVNGIEIEAVEAGNKNHSPKNCVGYIITIDGLKLYVAGDTSKTEQMETFSEKEFDYAFLPCDGMFNMDAKEAAECAEIIGAKHNIPYHTKSGSLFDRDIAESFEASNRLIVEAAEEIMLE